MALSFQYPGPGRTGSSRNCDGQRDPTVTPRWAKGPHSDTTSVSSSTGGGIRRTCQDGLQKEGNKKITAIQRQESLTKCCPRASMCAPREKEGPGNQGQLWCPARNSETEPVGQGTEECAARSESNTDPALRTPRRHWMEHCIYGWRLLPQQNNDSQRKAGVGGRWRNFHWIFQPSPRLSVDHGKSRGKKNLQRSADSRYRDMTGFKG